MERHDHRHGSSAYSCSHRRTGEAALTTTVRRHADAYHDSMLLMAATRALTASTGVDWGTALMATPQNVELLAEQGVDAQGARANDLLLAVRAESSEDAMRALDAAEAVLAGTRAVERDLTVVRPRTITAAVADLAGANVAVVSVPGSYAALAAHQALSAGMDVLLFSDGVSVDDEVALKTRAESLGRLVMGPGAGTAVLGGVGLGFANTVSPGRVGVVAAAGTGAQEVLALLTAGGSGVAAVIGVGGRDLSRAVGGRMTRSALQRLAGQADVDVLLLVTKPPDPDVLAGVLPAANGKPLVVVAQGAEEVQTPAKVHSVRTIDEGVEAALTELGMPAPELGSGLRAMAETAIERLDPGRIAVRGVFSGGSLCYQAMHVLSRRLGPIHSNTPLHPDWRVPAPPGAHVCIDAGEEEFTVSRPHPMIDAEARADLLRQAGDDPITAVLLFDVVLGHGAHPDPAGVLAPVVEAITGPSVVVHVLGTDADPQGLEGQRRVLADAGCLVARSGARAALLAAAVAARNASLVEEAP
jgi:FdrA protein